MILTILVQQSQFEYCSRIKSINIPLQNKKKITYDKQHLRQQQ